MTPTDREKALWDKLNEMDRDAWRDERGAAFIAIAAALSEARKDAIEECAKAADEYENMDVHGYEVGRAIRALKERTP